MADDYKQVNVSGWRLRELLKIEQQAQALRDELQAARDVLVAFGKQAGVVQGGYSTTLTEEERKLWKAVEDIDRLLAARLLGDPAQEQP